MAALRMFVVWETFLEETFYRYALGAKSLSGFKPDRFIQPRDLDHARGMVLGAAHFVKWNDPQEVIQRAETYFKGGRPYADALGDILGELQAIKIIRDRIAHSSGNADKQFRNLVRLELGTVPQGMTVGRFLLGHAASPHQTAAAQGVPGQTGPTARRIEFYAQVLKYAAGRIVP